jgi:hypothetical protein
MESALDGCRPDFIVIDGPKAESEARLTTLPQVMPSLHPGASFFLDDALRDGEINIAKYWSKLPHVHVIGIALVGKGFLVGRVEASSSKMSRNHPISQRADGNVVVPQ